MGSNEASSTQATIDDQSAKEDSDYSYATSPTRNEDCEEEALDCSGTLDISKEKFDGEEKKVDDSAVEDVGVQSRDLSSAIKETDATMQLDDLQNESETVPE